MGFAVEILSLLVSFFVNMGQKIKDKLSNAKSKRKLMTKVAPPKLKKQETMAEMQKFPSVTCDEVKKCICEIKGTRSTGLDGLSLQLIRKVQPAIIEPLTVLINRSLDEGIFPTKLKESKLIPLFKGGDPTVIDNYRPISLLPIFSKIYEKLAAKRLYEYFEANKILSDKQYGFRKNRSTELAITDLIMNIKSAQDDGLYSLAIFLDLTKAFDCVDFDILLETLEGYGIKSTVLEWIRSYLTNRRCKILANGILSDSFDVTCGVPQGSVLGPLLFLIYVNELSADIPFAYIINFADDTVLFLTHKNREQLITNAEVCLQAATEFFEERLLSLNTKKTKYIIFKHGNDPVYDSKINTADHKEIE